MYVYNVCMSLCRGKMKYDSDYFFFQAEDGIRDLVRSRGLGDVYKRQAPDTGCYPDCTCSSRGNPI